MTDDETTPPADPEAPDPATPEIVGPAQVMRVAGFDPDLVRAVIVTPVAVYAVAVDCPEPIDPPTEEQP